MGRGLGNKFLSNIGQADALIHVVDASGSVDVEGNITQPGSGNPVQDVMDIEFEIERWIAQIISHNKQLIARETAATSFEEAMTKTLSGIKARLPAVASSPTQAARRVAFMGERDMSFFLSNQSGPAASVSRSRPSSPPRAWPCRHR